MPDVRNKASTFLIVLLFLATCGIAFGLPFFLSGTTPTARQQAYLSIPGTKDDVTPATRTTEQILTKEAFATLFFSPTVTLTGTATSVFTLTFSPTTLITFTPSPTYTTTASPTFIIRFTSTSVSGGVFPTSTPVIIPSATNVIIIPTKTPVPPTYTQYPPTYTSVPSTDTPIPDTPIPDTPVPNTPVTDTPIP